MESKYKDILIETKEKLEDMGYHVAYISLYGSQNYGLELDNEEYKSDVDLKAIVMPTLDDYIYERKPASTSITIPTGLCDIKDIRLFFELIMKGNPPYIEILFSEKCIIDKEYGGFIKELISIRESLLKDLKLEYIKSLYGVALQKQKALCHPYPSIIDKIERYGYDGKQLHHIHRLLIMTKKYFLRDKPFSLVLKDFSDEEYKQLIDMKLNKYSLDEANKLCSSLMSDFLFIKKGLEPNLSPYNKKIYEDLDIMLKNNIKYVLL